MTPDVKEPVPVDASLEHRPPTPKAPLAANQPMAPQGNMMDWQNTIPNRLKKRLTQPAGKPATNLPKGSIIILYAGKDDSTNLKHAIQDIAPHLAPLCFEVEIDRNGAEKRDMLAHEPWLSLLHAAKQGHIEAIFGGPNCRTWSILLHTPKQGAPTPVRGRERDCWGLQDLSPEERSKVDNDSILLLRQLALFEACPNKPLFLLEHPEDPAIASKHPHRDQCSSFWITKTWKTFKHKHRLFETHVDQCQLGHMVRKPTCLGTNLPFGYLHNKRCTHPSHEEPPGGDSRTLARWGPGLNKAIAKALLAKFPTPASLGTFDKALGKDRPQQGPPPKHPSGDIHDGKSGDQRPPTDRPTYGPTPQQRPIEPTQFIHWGFRSRPIRTGGGKVCPGRLTPGYRLPTLPKLGKRIQQMVVDNRLDTTLQAALCSGETVHPFATEFSEVLSDSIQTELGFKTEPCLGQPFELSIISNLARAAGDPDWQYPEDIRHGVDLGVTEPTWTTPGVWPTKEELAGQELPEEEFPPPCSHDNYSSAEDHLDIINQTYQEEKELGMVMGPYTPEEAAAICGCKPDELCHGALGARIEADKVRTIHDGSVNNVNARIKQNSVEKTTAPLPSDAVFVIREHIQQHHQEGNQETLLPFKLDVTKAHRRIKVKPKDWRFMTAQTDLGVWVNCVGTYGIASAQLYWGRMAALLLRLLYHTFPEIYWAFVYVDDYLFLLRRTKCMRKNPWITAAGILLFLQLVKFPISWKKTVAGFINTWLGFQFNSLLGTIYLSPPKQEILQQICTRLIAGEAHTKDEIMTSVGRLQWCTGAFPHIKPFLQPLYAWMTKVQTHGRPGKRHQLLAKAILILIQQPPPSQQRRAQMSNIQGASDAGADKDRAVVGGWVAEGAPSSKHETWWFHETLNPTEHPWAFDKGDAKQRIAAIELYGTLLLTMVMIHMTTVSARVQLPMVTDNQGNAYAVLGHATRRWPNAAILMELMLQTLVAQATPHIQHVKRDKNVWADQLTHLDFEGFDYSKEIDLTCHKQWKILPQVLCAST